MSARLAIHVALALALLSCSKAPGVQSCPTRYDALPLPAGYQEWAVPAPDVPAKCASLGDTMAEPLGCYAFSSHIAVIPTEASDPLIARAVKLHERCHAKGWPANHPS